MEGWEEGEEREETRMESKRCFQAVALCDLISLNLSADTGKSKQTELNFPVTRQLEENLSV